MELDQWTAVALSSLVAIALTVTLVKMILDQWRRSTAMKAIRSWQKEPHELKIYYEQRILRDVDWEDVDTYFEGVMIKFTDLFDKTQRQCPGWECKACGWRIGARGLPPWHYCPEAGDDQRRKRDDK